MKKIGFVDYYMSEWHANNYPAWIKRANEEMGLDYELTHCWAEIDTSPLDGVTTDAWCEKYGVTKCETLDELCNTCDFIVVLSPKNPEKHLGYAEAVLKHGKRTYIDKTFAPDLETAKKIFEIGERYGTDFFSSSALRYATELQEIPGTEQLMVLGSGSNFEEYFIHLAEMVVATLGGGFTKVKSEPCGSQWIVSAKYPDQRDAVMVYGQGIPYSAYMTAKDAKGYRAVKSEFFVGLIKDILNFFETGKISFDPKDTLEVMKLVELAIKATKTPGEYLNA